MTPLKWVVMFAPLVMVFVVRRHDQPPVGGGGATVLLRLRRRWSACRWPSSSRSITQTSIAQTFLVTAIAFAGLSLYGYTTKRSLSAMGSFLMMGLIGLIVASIVNIFLASSALAFAISAIGVLIFAGLTAWDTQKIKMDYVAHAQHGDAEWLGKSAIMGALTLYLDFINMFMFLLQFLGNSRD